MQIDLRGIGHKFPRSDWLFRDLNATLLSGKLTAVMGPSGSGKSTLLGVIAGWISPTEGVVAGLAGRVSAVFQNPHGVPRRTAVDHVAIPLLAQGRRPVEADHDARELLSAFGLSHVASHPFSTLSGGEAQRLLLARALAAEPSALLVDEPTAQLDPPSARVVAESLRTLSGRNTLVIVATHDSQVSDFCDSVLQLETRKHP